METFTEVVELGGILFHVDAIYWPPIYSRKGDFGMKTDPTPGPTYELEEVRIKQGDDMHDIMYLLSETTLARIKYELTPPGD